MRLINPICISVVSHDCFVFLRTIKWDSYLQINDDLRKSPKIVHTCIVQLYIIELFNIFILTFQILFEKVRNFCCIVDYNISLRTKFKNFLSQQMLKLQFFLLQTQQYDVNAKGNYLHNSGIHVLSLNSSQGLIIGRRRVHYVANSDYYLGIIHVHAKHNTFIII